MFQVLINVRFFVDSKICAFEQAILNDLGSADERTMLFPSATVASKCIDFIAQGGIPTAPNKSLEVATSVRPRTAQAQIIRLINFVLRTEDAAEGVERNRGLASAVIYPKEYARAAKTFWQHSGDGISSRRAEFCYELYRNERLIGQEITLVNTSVTPNSKGGRGPRRYQKGDTHTNSTNVLANSGMRENLSSSLPEHQDLVHYIEERYGRNLTLQQAENAKLAIRRRIAGSLVDDLDLAEVIAGSNDSYVTRNIDGFTVDDVYLYPSGMSSIFNTHQNLLAARGSLKSVSFG